MSDPKRVLIAPDSFKGSATAAQVAQALAEGWRSVRPDDRLDLLAMADGGEGTLDAFAAAQPAARRMAVTVTGPDNRAVTTQWLLLPEGTGVVELACTSGITLLEGLRPIDAHTLGFGQAIAAALDHGVTRLLLALGGSSSTDGGTGALTALGARFLDENGEPVHPGNSGLARLHTVDLSGLRPLPPRGAAVLSDVTNPLLGPRGAAAIFGPQKGADPQTVAALERGLRRLAEHLHVDPDTPGAGAAGGTGSGLLAWGAVLESGSRTIGESLGLPAAVAEADIVVTGEGRFDTQSLAGKVPGHVADLATAAGTTALLVAGRIDDAPNSDVFQTAQELAALAHSADTAMAEPIHYLREAGTLLAAWVTNR